MRRLGKTLVALLALSLSLTSALASPSPTEVDSRKKIALFGDLHIHTGLSLDAFAFGVLATPDDAYHFARGQPIKHSSGDSIALKTPLDFMAVTDHAEYLGVFAAMREPSNPLSQLPLAVDLNSKNADHVARAVARMKRSIFQKIPMAELLDEAVVRDMWQRSIEAAQRNNHPGKFTGFIGFEWSATVEAANLHRNVIFAGDSEAVPPRPFSALEDSNPEGLWAYLEAARADYGDVIAIPHNGNLSNGKMFPAYSPEEASANSARRARNEPLYEIAQIKGSSETHPQLAPTDDWASFELLEELMGGGGAKGAVKGSYARGGLLEGLLFEANSGMNPYEFGIVAGSDSHNASSPVEEDNYSGKIGRGDDDAQKRRSGGSITSSNLLYSAAGLTGVWAEANTREDIFAALRRRETFGTSGSRIKLRLMADWRAHQKVVTWADFDRPSAVAMGGHLQGEKSQGPPHFFAQALRDANSAPLQRMQIVKGWLRGGELMESVIDIACPSRVKLDREKNRCESITASVDLQNCHYDEQAGADTLQAQWIDSDFRADEHAFYYLRVLENPTCRWSTWDAIRNDLSIPEDVEPTLMERAWSSPIWYSPASD